MTTVKGHIIPKKHVGKFMGNRLTGSQEERRRLEGYIADAPKEVENSTRLNLSEEQI